MTVGGVAVRGRRASGGGGRRRDVMIIGVIYLTYVHRQMRLVLNDVTEFQLIVKERIVATDVF